MTYMWEFPNFERHFPSINASVKTNKWYGLYHYSEGAHYLRKKGVPVLFIPGNSGSYKQVRSFASVSLRMSLKYGDAEQLFDYFTVDLNEELSALSGAIVRRQTVYVDACLAYISSLYGDNRPIVIIGHSMGALVARAVVTKSAYRVVMIVALASPLEIPVVSLDGDLVALYREINRLWSETRSLDDIVVISITGGNRDLLVWDGYGRVTTARHSLWLPAWSVALVGVSTDHLSVCWCRELVIAVTKAMHRSLSITDTPAPHTLLARMQRHLSPTPPQNGTANMVIDRGYPRLLLRAVTVHVTAATTVAMAALSSVTRPLSIKILADDSCPTHTDTRITLHGVHRHTHRLTHRHEAVLLAVADLSPSLLAVNSPFCGRHSVTLSASLSDWMAHLIRIHYGRTPALVAAHVIAQHTHTQITLPLVLATVWLCSALSWHTDITWLHSHIDIADIAVLLVLALPLAVLISTVASLLTAIFARLPSSVIPAVVLLPFVVVFAATCPSLALLSLLLLHLLSPDTTRNLRRQELLPAHTVTAIVVIVLLLELAPLVADIHSLVQHENLRTIVASGLASLTSVEAYGVPGPTVLVPVAVVAARLMRPRPEKRAPSFFIATNLWLASVLLGACCLLLGAVDSSRCGLCLVAVLAILEIVNLVAPLADK